jgi:hypothetical protein
VSIFVPREPQVLMRNFALELADTCGNVRGNLFASPGTGKTGAAYEIFDIMRMMGAAKRALVIAPLRVAKNVWPAERQKWHESFGHLTVAAAIGTPDQRKAVVRSNPDILCINYENVEWLCDGYGHHWPFDTVFSDESTRLKALRIWLQQKKDGDTAIRGQGSVRAKALARVAFKYVRNWINLTGGPAPNGLADLWGQMFYIDAGRRLGTDFGGFQERWFYSHMSDGYATLKPHSFAQKQIEDLLKDVCITVDARDYFPISEPLVREIPVILPPKARKAYDEMQRDFFALVESNPVEAFTNGTKMNKCLQIASGSVYHDREGNWVAVHNEKIEALKSLKEELNGEPILVRYCYRPDKARILKAFPRARALDDKQSTVDAWNAGDLEMLVIHGANAGHGLSLQDGGRVLCDYSSEHNFDHDMQILERIGPTRQFQSGHDRLVYRYRLIAQDTLEQTSVLPALKHKLNVDESVRRAMKKAA